MVEMLPLGYFYLNTFYIFYTDELFNNMICCTYFNIQEQLDVDVLDFFSLIFDNLATVLATFGLMGNFFLACWGRIFSHVQPFYEWAVSNLDP